MSSITDALTQSISRFGLSFSYVFGYIWSCSVTTDLKVELRFHMAICSVPINLSPKNNCRKGEERREALSTASAIEISPELHFELNFRNI